MVRQQRYRQWQTADKNHRQSKEDECAIGEAFCNRFEADIDEEAEKADERDTKAGPTVRHAKLFHEERGGYSLEFRDDATKDDIDKQADNKGENIGPTFNRLLRRIKWRTTLRHRIGRIEIERIDEQNGYNIANGEDVGRISEAVEFEPWSGVVFG